MFLFQVLAECVRSLLAWFSVLLLTSVFPTWLPHVGYSAIHILDIKSWSWTQTCWCFLSISSSSASTFVCFSFTFISSSSLAWSSSSWRVTWRRGFTCKDLKWRSENMHSPIYRHQRKSQNITNLREDSPPLPVPKLQICSTIPLQDFQCTQLLLFLCKGPEDRKSKIFCVKYCWSTVRVFNF